MRPISVISPLVCRRMVRIGVEAGCGSSVQRLLPEVARHCGSHLFVLSPSWSDWVYPAASAIDTELPNPPEMFHINLAQKPSWISVPEGPPSHAHFDAVPEESIEDWHKRHGLYED